MFSQQYCCDIQYELYVFEGRYDSFYHLALYNLVLGLTTDYFIEIQAVQMTNVAW